MPEGDTTVECKDCSGTFIFTAEERANFDARGYSPLVRCADCRKAKRERFASFDGESTTTKPPEVPTYDAATEAKLLQTDPVYKWASTRWPTFVAVCLYVIDHLVPCFGDDPAVMPLGPSSPSPSP